MGVLHERSKKLVYELSIATTLHLGAHTAYRAGSDTNTATHILRTTSLDDTHNCAAIGGATSISSTDHTATVQTASWRSPAGVPPCQPLLWLHATIETKRSVSSSSILRANCGPYAVQQHLQRRRRKAR